MIFVTVGTHHQPFQRLLDSVERLSGEELIVQYGCGRRPRAAGATAAYMSFDEVLVHLETARAVITHAGVGSILCAARLGHTPIVVPRLRRLGEHVDDHQRELTRALAARARVLPVWDVEALAEALASVPGRGSARRPGGSELAGAVRRSLDPSSAPAG